MNELFERLKSETPLFFKRLRALALTLSGMAAAVKYGAPLIDGFVITDDLATVLNYCMVAGLAAGGVSSTACKATPEPRKKKVQP